MKKTETRPQNNIPTLGPDILRQVSENIDQVVWLRDNISGQILYVSPSFESVWGIKCENLYANPQVLIESVHLEDRVQVMVSRDRSMQKPFDQDYRIVRPDGSLRWISTRSFLVRADPDNTPYQVYIAQDITKQKHVDLSLRKALDRSREQFTLSRRMSLARKPDVVLKTLMSAQEIRSAQRAALLFFNDPQAGPSHGVELTASWLARQDTPAWLSESDLYDDPTFWDLVQPGQPVIVNSTRTTSPLPPILRDFLRESTYQSSVFFPLVTSGIWLGCLVVYFFEDVHFSYIELAHLKVLIDQATITLYNLKLLKTEEESRHEAERANEIKTEFLAMISHELRTPLTSIIGYTTTLLAKDVTWDPAEKIEFIETIQKESFRLQELIDHLLDLSRLEAGRLPIQFKSHLMHEIIQSASPQLNTLTREHIFSIHISDNLPPVFADDKRVAQVIVNLVRNASSYSPKGTEINISANLRGNFLQINVSDQGSGIPLSEHKRVFQAFRRGVSEESGSTKGAGLGLAICKGLVEAHGGRIWIKSKSRQGTTFCFTLPLVPKTPAEMLSGKG